MIESWLLLPVHLGGEDVRPVLRVVDIPDVLEPEPIREEYLGHVTSYRALIGHLSAFTARSSSMAGLSGRLRLA